jgi:acetylornithine deacetylase
MISSSRIQAIKRAVETRFEEQVEFLRVLTSHASTRGQEQSAQQFMAKALSERQLKTDVWNIEVKDIEHLPGFSPVIGQYDDAINVVGIHRSREKLGRSLILNGHIDVVPTGPLNMWKQPPFEPYCEDGWMAGRGVGDMKAGLVANLFALDALSSLGYQPAADVYFQSVVEEECTGNGALACLQRGYRADAALIPEPFNEQLMSAQIGVIWFQVHLKGVPVHVLEAASGSNAIEAAIPLIAALRDLEKEWNKDNDRHPLYAHVEHPLNLNIGKIEGGDWGSSVPAWCCFDARLAIYPGQDIGVAQAKIEACIKTAAAADSFLKQNPPEIIYHGFLAEGYALAEHKKPEADLAVSCLERAHQAVRGDDLQQLAVTATTDARFFGLYADIPALVYGPTAENIHGFNERVSLDSMRNVTQSIALFIADWCGLESISK